MKRDRLLKKIDLYLEGELSPSEAAEIERYLKKCPECEQELEKYRKLLLMTKAIAKFTPAPPPDLQKKIMLQIERVEKKRRFIISNLAISFATAMVILSILYLPGMLNITGETTLKMASSGMNGSVVATPQVKQIAYATNISPSPGAIEVAKKQFDLFTAELGNGSRARRITYIIPITSSSSWQKVASYLKNFGNNYKVAIKPIIRNKNGDYTDVMAQLQRVKTYNPGVEIEDVAYNPSVGDQYPGNAGVFLQISVER